jgi:hypothetical protein
MNVVVRLVGCLVFLGRTYALFRFLYSTEYTSTSQLLNIVGIYFNPKTHRCDMIHDTCHVLNGLDDSRPLIALGDFNWDRHYAPTAKNIGFARTY